jgi:hypothetical protein
MIIESSVLWPPSFNKFEHISRDVGNRQLDIKMTNDYVPKYIEVKQKR